MFKHMVLWIVVGILALGSVSNVSSNTHQQSTKVITAENASQLVEQIRLGRGSADHAIFSPDGNFVFVAGSVGIWRYQIEELETPVEPFYTLTEDQVLSIAIHPDGSSLAAGVGLNILFYDTQSLEETGRISTSAVTEVLRYGAPEITYSPDGANLAINAGSNGILLYDIATESIQVLEGSFDLKRPIRFSPDGAYLVALGDDQNIYLWNITTKTQHGVLAGHTRNVSEVAFTPDGTQLISVSGDKSIRIWNMVDITEAATITDGIGWLNTVAVSSDGTRFVTGDNDGKLALWNKETQTAIYTVETSINSEFLTSVSFSPDNSQLLGIVAAQTVYLWSAETGEMLRHTVGHTPFLEEIIFSPDSATLAIADINEDVWLWDTTSNQELHQSSLIPEAGHLRLDNSNTFAYSPDGSMIASSNETYVELWDVNTHELLYTLPGTGRYIESLAFSPDSSLIIFVDSDALYIFTTANGELITSFVKNSISQDVLFSPNQTMIAMLQENHTVKIYSVP